MELFDTSLQNPHGPHSIKNLIWWAPLTYRWAIWIQKAKKDAVIPTNKDFRVDSLLNGDEFNVEYKRIFIEVATTWNKFDGSKRARILLADDAASSQPA